MDQLGLQGVQIGSHCDDWNLDAPELFAFFEAASRSRRGDPRASVGHDGHAESMPKYWLPWLVGMPAEQSRAACCLMFGGVLERLPKLRVCSRTAAAVSRTPSAASSTASTCARTWSPPTTRAIRASISSRMYFDSCVHDDARAALSARICGVTAGDARHRLSFPARRAGAGQRHRSAGAGRHRTRPAVSRHRAGMAGLAVAALRPLHAKDPT